MKEKTRLFYEFECQKLQPIIDFVCEYMSIKEDEGFYNYIGKGKDNIAFCKQMISYLARQKGISKSNIGRKLYPNDKKGYHSMAIYNENKIKTYIKMDIDMRVPYINSILRKWDMLNNI